MNFRTAAIAAVIVVSGIQPAAAQEAAPWVTRFTAKHVIGEGVGRDEGFTSLEWLLPLEQDSEMELWFGDFRGIIFEDAEFGGNLGAGYRRYIPAQDRIYGVNAYWDFRNESSLLFNQAGIGFETLGRIFDFRVNGYTPTVNDASQRLPFTFVGNNLLNTEIHGLSGIDYEVAANLPDAGQFQTRIAGGGYYFDSSNTDAAAGWRARIEIAFRDTIAASVVAQEDDVFGSTINVIVEFRQLLEHFDAFARRSMYHKFRNERGSGDGRTIIHRLADPVYRQQNIVLKQTEGLVVDSLGTPLTFIHVTPGVGGTGTIEDPYGTLAAAMADPLAPTSVVYTPAGGAFTEDVTLVAGTRLLSNGPVQFVPSALGKARLPFSGAGPNLNALPASITGNVTAADNTELSGFEITGGVSGAGVTTMNINHLAVNSAPADAISFTGSNSITLDTLAISMPTARGILLDDSAAAVSNVTIADAGDDGIQVDTAGTDRSVTATSVTITNAGNEGIDVNVAGAGDLSAGLTSTSVTAVNNAIDIRTTAAGDALVSLSDTTLESTAGAGFSADGSAGTGTLFVNSTGTIVVRNAAAGGLLFNTVTFDADPVTAGIQQVVSGSTTVGSTTNRISGTGVSLTNVTGNWNAGTLNIFNQDGQGLFADNSGIGTPVTLASTAGSMLNTQTGPAIELNTAVSSLVFDSITSTSSATRGVGLTTVTGSVTSGSTAVSGSILPSIRYESIALPDTLTAGLGNTTINSTISNVPADNIEKIGVTDGLTENYTPLTVSGP